MIATDHMSDPGCTASKFNISGAKKELNIITTEYTTNTRGGTKGQSNIYDGGSYSLNYICLTNVNKPRGLLMFVKQLFNYFEPPSYTKLNKIKGETPPNLGQFRNFFF